MRLIDADALPTVVGTQAELPGLIVKAIQDAPTIDAVPVVRCKYCRYSYTEKLTVSSLQGFLEYRYIRFCNYDPNTTVLVADMHFCACGERRENNV